ncbi:MAG: response regulator transcription factor [Flavobacteriales bacterium]|jgi:DNA-binding NarL/FixJ family response regulator|nr:response regulator transcription factor [Flavobacteriales bacterium]
MKKTIKIVIAEDHPLFLSALTNVLNEINEIEVVGTFEKPEFVIPFIKNNEVDILVTDLDMPNISGLRLSKEVKELFPEIKIMVVSMLNKNHITMELKEIGISGYLLKDAKKKDYEQALNTILNNESYFCTDIEKELKKAVNSESIKLSKRENEVLLLIAEELTMQEIAEKLFVSPTTVISHRKRLMQKLSAKNTAGLIKKAIQNDLLKT